MGSTHSLLPPRTLCNNLEAMYILAIETSCDETGISLLEVSGGLKNPRLKVIKNLVSSQIKIHRPFGGVVPNLAKREHLKNLPLLFKRLMKSEPGMMDFIDLITVTVGPGLEPALWTGIEFAKELAKHYKKPLIGANHLEGHLYSFLLQKPNDALINRPILKKTAAVKKLPSIKFPAIALIVSGGHTNLLALRSFSKWTRLGETRDDAAGEAFDKVARLLSSLIRAGRKSKSSRKLAMLKLSRSPDQCYMIKATTSVSPASRPPCSTT